MEPQHITLDSLLDDEDLHAELRALGWNEHATSASKKGIEKSNVKAADPFVEDFEASVFESHFDVESIANIGVIDENNIQLEDGDLQDPELLSLYQEMSGDSSTPFVQPAQHNKSAAQIPPAAVFTKAPSMVQAEDVTQTAGEILSYSNLTPDEATRRALEFKRQGNTQEALKWFRLSKQLDKAKGVSAPVPSALKPAPAPSSSAAAKNPPKPLKPAKPTAQTPAQTPAQVSSPPPRTLPSSTPSTTRLPQPTESSEKASTTNTPKSILEKDPVALFESALLEASNLYLKEAKRLKEANQAKLAIEKMKKYKYYQQELAVLQSRKQIHIQQSSPANPSPLSSLPLPLFSWRTHRVEERVEHVDIAENELRVHIAGLYNIEGLISAQGHRTISLSLSFGKGGAEKEEGESIEVAAVRSEDGASIAYDVTRTLPILKRSKLSQQLYSRKKVTVELQMSKSGGFFSFGKSQYSVAMAVLPLADLLTKCSTGGDLPLYSIEKGADGSSKKGKGVIGGVLRMTVTVRTPLVSPEMKVSEERELIIEAWPTSSSTSSMALSPSQQPLSSSNPNPATPFTTATTPNTQNTQNTKSPLPLVDAQSSARLAELEKQLSERERSEPDSIDFIESNDVLEAEIAQIEQEIAHPRSRGPDDEDDLLAKRMQLQMLQAKLQILVFSVQSESLSLDDYLNKLRHCIERDRRLALYQKLLNTAESKTLAIKVMKRMKIMENELKNAEESMQEEG